MKKLLSSLTLLSMTACGALAADIWLVDLSCLDQLIGRPAEVAALRIGIPYGANPTITGLDIGVWGRSERAWGLQVNLFVNDVREKSGGAQLAICNLGDDVTGIQLGLWNSTASLAGAQLGGLNYAENADFLQLGLANAANTMKGLQLGGWNSAPNFTGLQIGLVNTSQSVEGYQIGLLNRTDKMRGFQLGLINVITSSSLPVFPIFNCIF
ncbi:MAG: hypothetical protein WCI17_06450 [bacterium]